MSCEFNNNQEVLDKVREKGFSNQEMKTAYQFNCDCGAPIVMKTFECKCESCNGIYTVTPCSQDDINNIVFVK